MEDNDADIAAIRRFAQGEREALGEIASRHERAMLSLAKGLLGSASLAEEAVQDAWVRAIRGSATFEGRAAVRTWLYRIVINRCRDLAKRERRRSMPLPFAKPAPPPVQENGDRHALVRRVIASLPIDQREAVVLCVALGTTHTAAAELLDTPVGTVKSRVRLGLDRLRQSVGGDT
ncbi:MAG: RNA polymerase sigma factor [Planctomycetota bacterium]